MGKFENRLLVSIVLGIVAGTLCALLDLIPGDNIWTFSSFSGSLGFWAISGMLVVMLYDKAWKSALGTFLYFAFMNTSFFIVHFLISPLFQHPRKRTITCFAVCAAILPKFLGIISISTVSPTFTVLDFLLTRGL